MIQRMAQSNRFLDYNEITRTTTDIIISNVVQCLFITLLLLLLFFSSCTRNIYKTYIYNKDCSFENIFTFV